MLILHRRHFLSAAVIGGALLPAARPSQAQTRNVMDTMAADGRFDRFIDLITRAGGTDQLRATAGVTIFAPVNDAFQRVSAIISSITGEGGISSNETGGDHLRLLSLVQYHVVAGSMPSSGLTGDRRFKTVNGNEIRILREGSKITVTNPAPAQQRSGFGAGGLNIPTPATVVGPDIIANNGIIHAISEVLFP